MSNMTTNVKSNVLARGESRKRIPSADELHRGIGRVRGGFTATIYIGGKRHYLGFFKTKDEAGQAYAEAAKKYHGEFACLE